MQELLLSLFCQEYIQISAKSLHSALEYPSLKQFLTLSKHENREHLNKALFTLLIIFYQPCKAFFQAHIPTTGSPLQLDFAHLHNAMTCCHGNYCFVTNGNLCHCGRKQHSSNIHRKAQISKTGNWHKIKQLSVTTVLMLNLEIERGLSTLVILYF